VAGDGGRKEKFMTVMGRCMDFIASRRIIRYNSGAGPGSCPREFILGSKKAFRVENEHFASFDPKNVSYSILNLLVCIT
jgi:hypothetical protein